MLLSDIVNECDGKLFKPRLSPNVLFQRQVK